MPTDNTPPALHTASSGQPGPVRLSLTMPDRDKHEQRVSRPSTPSRSPTAVEPGSGGSPQRPSYSPVTPTLSHTSLTAQDDARGELPPPQWIDEPESLPVSLDDNPDAIALRATLSILQIQRQQALQDMRELDKMKQAALQEPEQFVKDLREGKLGRPPRVGLEVDDLEPVEPSGDEATRADASEFGKFPPAQNIVRSPPVEWTKYHIVGEPLERIHEVQQHYPGLAEERTDNQSRPQPHTIAAPYRPFVDTLDESRSKSNPRPTQP